MSKSAKGIYLINGLLLGLIVLYLAVRGVIPLLGLEYRFRVDVLGRTLYLLLLPLWLMGLGLWKLWQRFRENMAGRWLVRLVTGVASVIYLIWCCLATLYLAFAVNEDRSLGGGLVVVVDDSESLTRYTICESVGPFFRRRASLTTEAVAGYLADKYKREFYPVGENGETLYIDGERENIKVRVEFRDGGLRDDYPQRLADDLLAEGCQALGLEWDTRLQDTGAGEEHFCLVLDEEKNDWAFGLDVYRLTQYVLKREPLLKKYDVFLCLSVAEFEGQWLTLDFGRTRPWTKLSSWEYKSDETKMAQLVRWFVDDMRIWAFQERLELRQELMADIQETGLYCSGKWRRYLRALGTPGTGTPPSGATPGPEAAPRQTMREMLEAEYPGECEAAEAIWEAELKDLGYDFEVGADAKGHLVINLGRHPADKLQSVTEQSDYYLNYDRESKNGNCHLFVLVEVPEGYSPGDAYLREFYACEKGTLKVAVGNKTSWAQVGSASYRELTGE